MSMPAFHRLHGRIRSAVQLTVIAAAATLAAGCGGGGDSGPTGVQIPQAARVVAASAGSDVSVGNFGAVGAALARSVLASSSNALSDVTGASREAPQSRQGAGAARPLAAQWVARALRHAPGATSTRERPQAVHTESLPCTWGGSLTVSVNDADNNQKLSAGDSVSLTAFNCVELFGEPPLQGGFSMTVNAVELNAADEPVALDVSGSFSQMTVAGVGAMTGGFRLWQRTEAGGERMRLSYDNLSITTGGETVVSQHDVVGLFSTTGGSFELQGGLVVGGQTYSLVSGTPIAFSNGAPPHTGSLRLRDAAGDAVELVVRSATSYDLGFLPAGTSAAVATLLDQLWSALDPGV